MPRTPHVHASKNTGEHWRSIALATFVSIACAACVLPSGELPGALTSVFDVNDIQREDTPQRTTDGLLRVRLSNERGSVLYLRAPDPQLRRFDQLMLREPAIGYARGVRAWNEDDEAQVKAFILHALDQELFTSGRWKRSAVPGDAVLIVQPAAIDLDLETSPLPTGSNFSYRTGGSALLVLDVRESVTNRALLRFGQRRPLDAGNYTGWDVDRQRLEKAVRGFARLVGERFPEFEEAAANMPAEPGAAPAR